MKKFFIVLMMSLLVASTGNAEIKTYESTEEYLMSEFETMDIAKQRAKQKAERSAQEQAGVYISTYSETKDFELVKDEVVAITCGIVNVVDVKYSVTPADNATGFLIRATVKVNINSDDVNKWLEKSAQEKSTIVTQNKELQAAVAAQDATITKLKRQIEKLKAEGKLSGKREREKVSEEIAAEDKIFQANQKFEAAQKSFFNHNYEEAIRLCDESIKIYPTAQVYCGRGNAYGVLRNFQQTIADCTEAIKLDANYAMAYNDRGAAYGILGNHQQALADFNKAIELNPNLALAYNNRGSTFRTLGNIPQGITDLNRAIELEPRVDFFYFNRGLCYVGMNDAPNAIENFNKAIELNPNFAQAYFARGKCYQFVGNMAQAQADLSKAAALGFRG